jgi:hypothetical protein
MRGGETVWLTASTLTASNWKAAYSADMALWQLTAGVLCDVGLGVGSGAGGALVCIRMSDLIVATRAADVGILTVPLAKAIGADCRRGAQ